MLRDILLRVLPTDMLLRFHEGRKTSFASAAASSNPHGDSTGQTAPPEHEFQLLLKFFDLQLMVREAIEHATQKIYRTPEKGGLGKPSYLRDLSTASALQGLASAQQQCLFCRSAKQSTLPKSAIPKDSASRARRRCPPKPDDDSVPSS